MAMPGTCFGKGGGPGNERKSSERGECCSNVHIGGRSHNLRRCARDLAYASCSRSWLVSRESSRSWIAFRRCKTSRSNLSSIRSPSDNFLHNNPVLTRLLYQGYDLECRSRPMARLCELVYQPQVYNFSEAHLTVGKTR